MRLTSKPEKRGNVWIRKSRSRKTAISAASIARSAVSGGVVVYCLKNRKGMSRLGITVSTKLGHAVVRNRVRRRLRELYRLHRQEMLPGYDLIVVARVRAVDMPYAKLEKQYLRCLAQLGLLREDV